jgi:hypothetical protein
MQMNIIDSIIWVSVGFIPMLRGLELAWRLATKKLNKIERAHVQ